MRKLLLVLLAAPVLSFATSLDMSTLQCGADNPETLLKINTATTLKEVQDHCLIRKQSHEHGMHEVTFVNTGPVDKKGKPTNKTVTCMFASNTPTAVVNGCK